MQIVGRSISISVARVFSHPRSTRLLVQKTNTETEQVTELSDYLIRFPATVFQNKEARLAQIAGRPVIFHTATHSLHSAVNQVHPASARQTEWVTLSSNFEHDVVIVSQNSPFSGPP